MNTKMMLALAGAAIAAFGLARVAADAQANDAPTLHDAAPAGPSVARGRYLAKIAGCNDCHTPAYAMRGGDVPEAGWLIGDALGWQGPWGTLFESQLISFRRHLDLMARVLRVQNKVFYTIGSQWSTKAMRWSRA
jgi:mono/diheme cytochrome c family protein